ncbi:sigma 54-interacting transcriptional regulator [Bacillus sp. B15-48]|uniref:sigma-54 interaction domain-containing protein n=1 Tax=Bacillus sp. B15-48 TaxID=1548601 RepID=UPI00193ECDEF|nr:sigma 54-interacting transcriptional regulator [Bacillus sp. B15-48]
MPTLIPLLADRVSLDRIFNSTLEAVHIFDKSGKFVFINDIAEKELGIARNEWIGKHVTDLIPNSIICEVLYSKTQHVSKIEFVQDKEFFIDARPLTENGKLVGAIARFKGKEEFIKLKNILAQYSPINHDHSILSHIDQTKISPFASENLIISKESILTKELVIVKKLSSSDLSILIRGESGVGKEVMAKSIHQWSHRKSKPFIAINCAAIPESLLESELFGYEEGAFTGANRSGKKGKFELANYGTIFLDEIGDMSFHLQAKLLRVLQQKELVRVGGTEVIPLNVRVIAATNRDLEMMIQEETFREDLYYRMNGYTLNIPPLRERKEDIKLLIHHFTFIFNQKYHKELQVSEEVIHFLVHYRFPGNIRELINIMEYAFVIADTNKIGMKDLPEKLSKHYIELRPENLRQNVQIVEPEDKQPLESLDFQENINKLEVQLIEEALMRSNNNKSKAIKMLGISRRSFYERLKKYNMNL